MKMSASFVPPDVGYTLDKDYVSLRDIQYVMVLREALDQMVSTTADTHRALFSSPEYKPSPQNVANYCLGFRNGFQKIFDLTKALMAHNNNKYQEDPQPVFPTVETTKKVDKAINELKGQAPITDFVPTYGGKQKKSTTSKAKKSTKSRSKSRGRSRTRK
jgi:hypothetical protein